MRPFPSRKGWIVSNCTCARAALTSAGYGFFRDVVNPSPLSRQKTGLFKVDQRILSVIVSACSEVQVTRRPVAQRLMKPCTDPSPFDPRGMASGSAQAFTNT